MGDSEQRPPAATSGSRALVELKARERALAEYDAYYQAQEDDEAIDPARYWRVLVKRRWTVVSVVVFIVAATLMGTFLKHPVYKATATIQIEEQAPRVLEYQPLEAQQGPERNFYATQYQILRSRSLAAAVIDQLNLLENPEINGQIAQRGFMSGLHQVVALISRAIVGESSKAKDASPRDANPRGKKRAAVGRFLGRLFIEPVRNSKLVHVTFNAFDPTLASRAVNTLVNEYIHSNFERRYQAGEQARAFLKKQLALMQAKLERSDQALQDFGRKQHVADLEQRVGIAAEKLKGLHEKLAEVEYDRLAVGVERDTIRAGKGDTLQAIAESGLINELRQQLVEARAEYAKFSAQFKPDYPTMVKLQNNIDQLAERIRQEEQRVFGNILTHYHNLSEQQSALHAAINAEEDEMLALNQRGVQYKILKREVETNKELYDGLLQRMKEIGVAAGAQENNVAIIDAAQPPLGPAEPRPMHDALLALTLGLLAGVGFAFLLEFLDNTVHRAEEIEELLGLPALAGIPLAKPRKNGLDKPQERFLLARHQHHGAETSEAFRSLRTSLMFSSPKGMPRTLLVTSSAPAEGKTTVATNLATVLAQGGEQVLLADADLRHPKVHETFGKPQIPGLTQRIARRDLTGNACVHETDTKGLFVLTSGTVPPNPAEFLAPERTGEVLECLGELFDYVILDGPPVLGLADALVLAQVTQGVVVVASAGETRKQGLAHAVKRLSQVRAPLLGVVLNKMDLDSPDYDYYRGSYYGYYSYAGAHSHGDPAQLTEPPPKVRTIG